MSYDYAVERPKLFTEEGQVLFLAIRDQAKKLVEYAGAVRSDKLLTAGCGDCWEKLACMDRLVELGELREITGPDVVGQRRVFVAGRAGH